MYDVVVDEEQLASSCKRLKRQCDDIEDRLNSYLYLLGKIRSEVILAGDVAEGLTVFTSKAKRLRHQFYAMAADYRELCSSYKREIDYADDLLFY